MLRAYLFILFITVFTTAYAQIPPDYYLSAQGLRGNDL